jgi:hypothetical protein
MTESLPVRFVIFAAPCTGSNLLCGLLNTYPDIVTTASSTPTGFITRVITAILCATFRIGIRIPRGSSKTASRSTRCFEISP